MFAIALMGEVGGLIALRPSLTTITALARAPVVACCDARVARWQRGQQRAALQMGSNLNAIIRPCRGATFERIGTRSWTRAEISNSIFHMHCSRDQDYSIAESRDTFLAQRHM